MSFNFGPLRVLTLILCFVGFWLLGGFDMAGLSSAGGLMSAARIWLASVMMFIFGAVCVSLIDHESGHMEPRTNLRGLYIALGVLLMAGACWFIYGIRNQ